ncbi:circularly permuted type 2 ATP-grasp protein [Pseudotabrizicola sp. 4114]|uniref:circularly permuted type 2 ATP-grasp protein n=1 Tax=Pseudotabrizicola sp. 4114 TaxID=2817731 RepID=UPI0032B83ABB
MENVVTPKATRTSTGKPRDRGLSAYRPLPGVPDELVSAEGTMRPLWQPLVAHLQSLSDEDLTRATGRADQYLRDSGVFYRQYGSGQSIERPWPLSHIPVLIDEADWAELTPALIQRADLLEAVMADLYGENRLVAEGHLPAALVAGNPEWLRPLVGVRPASGHYLHFVAFEIGRGPDGRWWVLADRTQAPSGAGYALENRVATARAYSDVFAGLNVHRLASFFRDFRDALLGLRGARDGRVAIMTPGPLNETYFEQAWIARYMGVSLVQGEDLTVADGRLMVRTVSGLYPLDVLWRRLDGSYADPLELDPASRIGTPGMVAVLRQGGLTMVNSLGSGVLETRALMAFLPKLSRHLTGVPLAMPNIATWWCGGLPERAQVMVARRRLVLSAALGTGLPFDRQGESTVAASLTPEELAERLAADGPDLVAQEAVTLSTTPALIDGKIVPRPMTLRVFLARTPSGWQVMQGGFARIGASADPTALAMQRGGSAADVWIVSKDEVPAISMVTATDAQYRRSTPGALPARAADNLYWLGRYVERTEGIIRLLRARHIRLAEGGRAALPLQKQMDAVLKGYDVDGAVGLSPGLLDTLGAAVATAGQVRDRFSPDGWSALNDLDKSARRMAGKVAPGDDAARALSALLRKLAGFSGLVHENMYRFFGWRFLSIGRQLERASAMTGLLVAFADAKAPAGALDLCIELGDSVLTHRRRFSVGSTRETVIELLALDPMNPRSVRHLIDGLSEQVQALPGAATHGQLSELGRAMLRCQVEIATATPGSLTTKGLEELRERLAGISDLLTEAYLR